MTRAVGSIQFKTLIILINDRIYDVLCYLKIKDVVLKQKHGVVIFLAAQKKPDGMKPDVNTRKRSHPV